MAGDPFVPTLPHRVWLANWYEVVETAAIGDRVTAFRYRTGQWMDAQKVGKSPGVASETCLEFVGPALFGGRAEGGEVFRCSDFGCGCGWGTSRSEFEPHVFVPGEPLGRPWATPRIQLAAVAEDQVENTWGALVPMIDQGPLSAMLRTGEEFIRHPSGNRDSRVEIVTSKANTRLGARISSGKCDETGLWTDANGMKKFRRTLARGAAGMGGRISESTNPYDPSEASVAQDTHESQRKDVLKHYFPPPASLNFGLKKDREVIFRWNYGHSPWVDRRGIEEEASALLETDPAEAERFFGNRIVAGAGSWLDLPKVAAKRTPTVTKPRTRVVGGFDGSDNDDHTGIRLATLDGHRFTPTYGEGRKTYWRPQDWGGRVPRAEVMAAWSELATQFEFVRVYCDPFMWESEIDQLAAEHGEKVFIKWPTNRLNPMHAALERYRTDLYNSESSFTWDGDPDLEAAMRNAVMRMRTVDPLTGLRRYFIGKASETQKIDLLMSDVLAHEALNDALAAGETPERTPFLVYY
jgi:hypothetical protein